MMFYCFKTYTTSYYFPPLDADTRYLYGLYSPYVGKLARIYWWLFTHSSWVRKLKQVKEEKLEFPYALIRQAEQNESLMSFNMGSPGPDQKISILGFDPVMQRPFFAKFSQKPNAVALSKNEIHFLEKLKGTGFVPRLYSYSISENYIFFKTEYLKGSRRGSILLNNELLEMLIKLAEYKIEEDKERGTLRHCLSHGDCCPWNMLRTESGLRLIDWEMAGYRPLGYDLFTYIFQTAFLLFPHKSFREVLKESHIYIRHYFERFGIENWNDYLIDFAERKIQGGKEIHDDKLVKYYSF